ncbi:hypothetical protein PG996_011299 [Apiospora saccharicola]|uniref:F-box domain-containing protein n=1 Tax=Apiospora saccharicola TaxID=335842 RepID=A0ABR1UEM8_9PEZI
MASTPSPTDMALLQLPPEIRNEIWGLVVRREKPVHLRLPSATRSQAHSKLIKYQLNNNAGFTAFIRSLDVTDKANPAPTSNAVFAVNRQVNREVRAVFCSINKLLITKVEDAWRLLSVLGLHGRRFHIGPVICWLDRHQTASWWVSLIHFLKFRTNYRAGPKIPLQLYFEAPDTPDLMEKWEWEFCIKKTAMFRVATKNEVGGLREVPRTPLGRLIMMAPHEEGGLSLVRFASFLFQTEIGFFDTLAHIPY